MTTTFAFKLQSPNWDNNGFGTELPLPVTQDTLAGTSLAALITLFDGDNKILDFRQLSEKLTLTGFFTVPAASDAGYSNPIQMRDELRRTRFKAANYGKNTGASASWLSEAVTTADWGNVTLPADERDAGTTRQAGRMRLIYDQYWDPTAGVYKKLFMYGVVSDFNFGPRAAATTLTRIPFSVTFIVGTAQLGG